jgi:hypothetical protein
MFQMSIRNMFKHFTFLGPQTFTQMGIFGTKRYHLATLRTARNFFDAFK